MKTLYDKLKEVEGLDEGVEDKYKLRIQPLQNLQRELFLRYVEYSKILAEAMSLRCAKTQTEIRDLKSIEQTVDELAEPFKSYRILIPQRKNREHNEKVEGLEPLIPDIRGLKRKGLFSLDNSVTNAGILLGLAFGVYYLSSYFPPQANDPEFIVKTSRMAQALPSAVITFFAPFAALIARSHRKEAIKNSKEAAQYLDNKIKELFP